MKFISVGCFRPVFNKVGLKQKVLFCLLSIDFHSLLLPYLLGFAIHLLLANASKAGEGNLNHLLPSSI